MFRLALNRFGMPTIIAWGKWLSPLLPKKGVKLHIVVGKPLNAPKIDSTTKEDATLCHSKCIAELKRIYEEDKEDTYGLEHGKVAKLEI